MYVLAVYSAAERAILRARDGKGPTLLECLTYRFRGHSLADPDELRSQAEKEFWAQRDPIKLLSKQLTSLQLVTAEELALIDRSVEDEISSAVEFALNSPEPPANELTDYIWA